MPLTHPSSSPLIPRLHGFRRSFVVTCIVALPLLAAIPAPGAEPARVLETHSVAGEALPGAPGATHELRLHLYSFQGTRWLAGDVVIAVWDAMQLLAQCGVALAGSELRLLEAPREFHFYSTPVSRKLVSGMAVQRPALFFVEDTRNQPAFEAEAIGRGNLGPRPELLNTVWITYGAHDLPMVVAHELVHLLSDSGEHSTEPGNLMREDAAIENTRLSDAQCGRLRARGEANELLKRR